jgi:hypothetical protein
MVKIPTFTTQARPTAETASVRTNLQISPTQNIGRAASPLTSALTDYYVREAKQEADNKAYKILSDLYINQPDGTKGLFTLQSESSTNANPSDSAKQFDTGVEKLWNYTKNNKLSSVDSFTRKALEKKFFATAGLFKTKSLEGSRLEQVKETKNVTDGYVLKESLALKKNGIGYLDTYRNNVKARVNADFTLDDSGLKKQATNTYIGFGELQLANDLVFNSPEFLKENIGKFTNLTATQKFKLLEAADKQILENNKTIFTSDLTLTENSTTNEMIQNYNEIKNGTFNGNIEKIKSWNALPSSDKAEILKYANTKRRSAVAEINQRNSAILNEKKDDAIINFKKIYQNSKALDILTLFQIDNIIGEPKSDYERNAKAQYVKLNEKIGLKEFNNKENFYKNFSIQKEILNGKITDHVTPFLLEGETEPKSIIERVGTQINKRELGLYINYLLPNRGNADFIENHKKVYKIIEKYYPQIEGPSVLNYLDTTTDNRLSSFQSKVLFNFSQGIKEGKEISNLLDPKSKDFIARNYQEFKPDKDALTKILSKTKQTNTDEPQPPPWNPDKEYKKYLKQKEQ